MNWEIAFTLGIVALALAAMIREIAQPDLVMMAALASLMAVGILTPAEGFAGFSNPVIFAIAFLFIVSAALRRTGVLDRSLGRLLGRSATYTSGALRICAPVAFGSAFLNNAPIVAMMTPAVIDWSRRVSLSPSRFLIPLSFAAILGSSTTLIGTSINLTVAGLVIDAGMEPLGFFELSAVGVPMAIAGLAYSILLVPRLLPDRVAPGEAIGDRRREYVTSMHVELDSPLVNSHGNGEAVGNFFP